jgi:O-methyltransferase involved in polyketide biosynthesis
VIVDLGCGLDTRCERVDNGQVEWCGLDLSEVIELRKELLDETPRNHLIGCSVLDFSWDVSRLSRAVRRRLGVAGPG